MWLKFGMERPKQTRVIESRAKANGTAVQLEVSPARCNNIYHNFVVLTYIILKFSGITRSIIELYVRKNHVHGKKTAVCSILNVSGGREYVCYYAIF